MAIAASVSDAVRLVIERVLFAGGVLTRTISWGG